MRRASTSFGNGFDGASDRLMEDSKPPFSGAASTRPKFREPATVAPAKPRDPTAKPGGPGPAEQKGGSSKGRQTDVILLVRRFFRVASAFFWGNEKWRARGMMASLIALACGGTGMHVLISYTRKDFANALTEKNALEFYAVVLRFAGIIAFAAPFFGVDEYVSGRMVLEWRVWLTRLLLKHYFSNRAFFNLKMEGVLDNPDQRICEDTANFVTSSVTVLKVLVEKLLSIFAFSAVLWSISPSVVAFLLTYAVLGTYITLHFFGKKMMKLKFDGLQREADMRYALVRVRDNVEAIAFYRGEQSEAAAARGFLERLAQNVQDRLRWNFFLEVFTNGYRFATFLIPGLVLAPRLFRGEIRYGDVVQTSMAFHEIFRAVTVIVMKFDLLSSLAAETERLESLLAALGLSGAALHSSKATAGGEPLGGFAAWAQGEPYPDSHKGRHAGLGRGTVKRVQLSLWEACRWLCAKVPFASQLLKAGKEKEESDRVNGWQSGEGSGQGRWAGGREGGRGKVAEGGSGQGKGEEELQPLISKPSVAATRFVNGTPADARGTRAGAGVTNAAEDLRLSERSFTEPPSTGSASHFDLQGAARQDTALMGSRGSLQVEPSARRVASGGRLLTGEPPFPGAEQVSHTVTHGSHAVTSEGQVQRYVGDSLVLTSLRIRVPGSSSSDLLFGPLGLSFSLSSSQSLLIMGPSGCGKSSLLRVISGLWSSGEGSIQCPGQSETFFLPQKPYMTLGSLRDQLLFPRNQKEGSAVDDRELLGLLTDVCLPNIAERFRGGLNEDCDWCATLSIGEQQRVAFSRLLLHRPSIAFLDEATSALDARNERDLYILLRQRVRSFVSVGHRLSLVPFHSHVLWFDAEKEAWSLTTSEEFSKEHAVVVEVDSPKAA